MEIVINRDFFDQNKSVKVNDQDVVGSSDSDMQMVEKTLQFAQ